MLGCHGISLELFIRFSFFWRGSLKVKFITDLPESPTYEKNGMRPWCSVAMHRFIGSMIPHPVLLQDHTFVSIAEEPVEVGASVSSQVLPTQ